MTNSTVNPSSNTTTIPTLPDGPAPEPGPDWPVARLQWGPAWELHWIGLGIAFALIAVHALAAIVMADKSKAFTRRPLFIAVNLLLIVLGLSRALYLWIDPYESAQHGFACEPWISKAVFGIAFPCLTAAFCLVHVAFLEVSKMTLGSKKLHSIPFVSSIIALHFIVVLISDTTVAFKANMTELLIVCQSFFIVWGFLNSFAFLYSGGRVIYSARQARSQLSQLNSTQGDRSKEGRTTNVTKVAKITMVTTVFGFVISSVQIYSMVGVYGMYSKILNPAPWPWYAFQTGFRLVELVMGWTLAYTVTQPSEYGKPTLLWRTIKYRPNNVGDGSKASNVILVQQQQQQ